MSIEGRIQNTRQAMERIAQDWRDDVVDWARHDLPKLLIILVVALVLLRVLRIITRRLEVFSKSHPLPGGMRAQQLRTLGTVVDSVGEAVILFVALLQVLPLFNVDVKPILASAGIVGLAVGFGAQTLVKDVINGFFVLLENQYDIGDIVRIAGVQGTVEVMTLRKTVIRDANGAVHTVPNSEIKVVSNLTRDWAQVALHVSVSYNEPSDKIIRILQEAGAEVHRDPEFAERMVAEPEIPGIERISGQDVDYLMLAKVKPGQQWAVSRELRRVIKDCFAKNGIQTGGPARIYVAEAGQPATEIQP